MPHITIDYSANLETEIDLPALCAVLRDAAVATGLFAMAGVRVRAFAATHVVIADGNPDHGYIDISLRLRGGRPLAARKAATAQVFAAAEAFLAPVRARRSLALSMEMRDIDPELSPKSGNTRDYL